MKKQTEEQNKKQAYLEATSVATRMGILPSLKSARVLSRWLWSLSECMAADRSPTRFNMLATKSQVFLRANHKYRVFGHYKTHYFSNSFISQFDQKLVTHQ